MLQVSGIWRQVRVRRGRAAGGSTVTAKGAKRPPPPRPAPRVHACHGRALDTPPPPLPPRFPPNQRPRTRRYRRAETSAPPPAPLRPRPRRSVPTWPHSPSRARSPRAAPLWALILGARLIRSLLPLGFPLAPQGSAPRWWQRQRAKQEGRVCVCESARGVCAGGPRAPLRAWLSPPALHAAMPVESLTRAPTARARARAHTGRAHTPAAAHPAPHPGLALLGRSQRPPTVPAGPIPHSAALRPPPGPAPPQVPRRSHGGPRGRPRSSTMPCPVVAALAARSPAPVPECGSPSPAPPAAARSFAPFPIPCPRRSLPTCPSPPRSLPSPLRLSCRRPLGAPSPPRCAASHSPHYTGCHPPFAGPGVQARGGRRGVRLALRSPLAPAWREATSRASLGCR